MGKTGKGTKTVEPIRKAKDIKLIKSLLADKPRDLAVFTLGINTNLRASDILAIKVDQVIDIHPGEDMVLIEKKTQKKRRITLNNYTVKTIQAQIKNLKASGTFELDGVLFKGQRGALTPQTLSRLVKRWCKDINLKGNYASHSLRKTWGYHQRVTYGVDIPTLMVCFNHSSQKQTLDYLCIQAKEVKNVYMNEL